MEVKSINTDTPAMELIHKIMNGMSAASVVQCAIELDIFDLVSEMEGNCTAEKVAEKNKYNLDATERLLNGLCSMKLLEKTKSGGSAVYEATDSGKLLAKNNPSTIVGNIAGPGSFYSAHMFQGLADVVRSTKKQDAEHGHSHGGHGHGHSHGGHGHGHSHGGHGHGHGHGGHDHSESEKQEYGKVTESASGHEGWKSLDMYRAMHNAMTPAAAKLLTAFDLSCHKSALDLGGGSGVLSYALKKQYPDMEVFLNDQDHVIEIAKEHFYKGNEHLNIKFLPGDFTKIDIPSVDLFIVSQVFHHVEKPGEFLETLHKKLNPGGAILILESILCENKDGPISTAMWDLMMLNHAGPGSTMRQRCPSEYNEILTKHGFKDVKIALTQDFCEYDVVYAKKA